MSIQIASIDDLLALENRIGNRIDELKERLNPPRKWVKGSVMYERYGYSPNKLKKLRRTGEIKSKLVGGAYMYDIASFEDAN